MMLLLAAVLLGKSIFFKTVAGSLLFPVVLEIVPKVEMLSSHFFLTDFRKSFVQSWRLHIVHRRSLKWRDNDTANYFSQIFRLPMPQGLLLTNSLIIF